MDTRGDRPAFWRRTKNALYCGQWETLFRIVGARSEKWTCKTWDCEICVLELIKKIKKLLNENIPGRYVFIAHIQNRQIENRNRYANNWISSHRPPGVSNFFYLSIITLLDITLISSDEFANHPSIRIPKRRYIDKDLPAYLLEHHKEVIRYSHSRTESNQTPGESPNLMAPVLLKYYNQDEKETHKDIKEFDKLMKNTEKAEWIEKARTKPGYHLTPDGQAFIQRHLGNQPGNSNL